MSSYKQRHGKKRRPLRVDVELCREIWLDVAALLVVTTLFVFAALLVVATLFVVAFGVVVAAVSSTSRQTLRSHGWII